MADYSSRPDRERVAVNEKVVEVEEAAKEAATPVVMTGSPLRPLAPAATVPSVDEKKVEKADDEKTVEGEKTVEAATPVVMMGSPLRPLAPAATVPSVDEKKVEKADDEKTVEGEKTLEAATPVVMMGSPLRPLAPAATVPSVDEKKVEKADDEKTVEAATPVVIAGSPLRPLAPAATVPSVDEKKVEKAADEDDDEGTGATVARAAAPPPRSPPPQVWPMQPQAAFAPALSGVESGKANVLKSSEKMWAWMGEKKGAGAAVQVDPATSPVIPLSDLQEAPPSSAAAAAAALASRGDPSGDGGGGVGGLIGGGMVGRLSGPVLAPLFRFDSAAEREASLDAFERVDDVIMGGISSSALVSEGIGSSHVSFCGVVREEGGGFCGQRTKLLKEPLDLSKYDGMYVLCRLPDVATAGRRIFKISLRTKQDRGEVIYSAELPALPLGNEFGAVLVPFKAMKLVRGPRVVPGAPPIDPAAVYQISMTCTKFHIDAETRTMENFWPGPFKLDVAAIGAYTETRPTSPLSAAALAQRIAVPLLEDDADKASRGRPLPLQLLKPLSDFVFSEKDRRRALAMQRMRAPRQPHTKRPQGNPVAARDTKDDDDDDDDLADPAAEPATTNPAGTARGGLGLTRAAGYRLAWRLRRAKLLRRFAALRQRAPESAREELLPKPASSAAASSSSSSSSSSKKKAPPLFAAWAASCPEAALVWAAGLRAAGALLLLAGRDCARFALTLPLKLAFKLAFAAIKLAKKAKAGAVAAQVGGATKDATAEGQLKLPPLG